MKGKEELIVRLAQHRQQKLGELSESAYQELLQSVRDNPAQYLDDPSDKAFSLVVEACERYGRQTQEEYYDEQSYFDARKKRLARLAFDSNAALEIDAGCVDAKLCAILARDLNPNERLDDLLDLSDEVGIQAEDHNPSDTSDTNSNKAYDAWDNVFDRGKLRVRLAAALACLDSGRYRMANDISHELLVCAPSDELGARHICMLALARLEDEAGFDALDAQLDRRGDSWSHLGRVLLLYKLGRTAAAKRALKGFAQLVEGGAYALLRPVMVDTYVPDRPHTKPCSFDEATLAVFEADPIVMDIPDFAPWAESIPEIAYAARTFAERNGFEW